MFNIIITNRTWCMETTTKFNLTNSQENLNELPKSGDIWNLDDIITIPIPDDIVQKHKDELKDIEKIYWHTW